MRLSLVILSLLFGSSSL